MRVGRVGDVRDVRPGRGASPRSAGSPALVAVAAAVAVAVAVGACARTEPDLVREPVGDIGAVSGPSPRREVQVGYATWYGARLAGHRTASGERFDPGQMTAAHRTLAFGTWVEVRRIDTGERVRVRITDRGPFGHEDRVIDLSREAARRLGMLGAGLTRVELRVVDGP